MCGGGKPVTSDKLALDIRKLLRAGRQAPGQSFQWQWSRDGASIATIIIRSDADRAKWHCPVAGCGRRVAVPYGMPSMLADTPSTRFSVRVVAPRVCARTAAPAAGSP